MCAIDARWQTIASEPIEKLQCQRFCNRSNWNIHEDFLRWCDRYQCATVVLLKKRKKRLRSVLALSLLVINGVHASAAVRHFLFDVKTAMLDIFVRIIGRYANANGFCKKLN